jgi:hypothetical protein
MTDEKKIEQAANDYELKVPDDYDPYGFGDIFKAGVAWRDENPNPKMLMLLKTLQFYAQYDCGYAAKQALAAWEKK